MGAWGAGIFENDLAADVRDAWREGLRAGEHPAALTARIQEEMGLDETEFWTGLAAAQFETGRLDPEVRDRALADIANGGDLEQWEGDEGRAAALRELADRLRGPQPKPKRLKPHPPGPDPGVAVGDVVRIPSEDGRRAALYHVVDMIEHRGERWPVLLGLYWPPADPAVPVPPVEELARLPYLSCTPYSDWPLMHGVMISEPDDAFGPHVGEVVARRVPRANPLGDGEISSLCGWETVVDDLDEIDEHLALTRARLERG